MSIESRFSISRRSFLKLGALATAATAAAILTSGCEGPSREDSEFLSASSYAEYVNDLLTKDKQIDEKEEEDLIVRTLFHSLVFYEVQEERAKIPAQRFGRLDLEEFEKKCTEEAEACVYGYFTHYALFRKRSESENIPREYILRTVGLAAHEAFHLASYPWYAFDIDKMAVVAGLGFSGPYNFTLQEELDLFIPLTSFTTFWNNRTYVHSTLEEFWADTQAQLFLLHLQADYNLRINKRERINMIGYPVLSQGARDISLDYYVYHDNSNSAFFWTDPSMLNTSIVNKLHHPEIPVICPPRKRVEQLYRRLGTLSCPNFHLSDSTLLKTGIVGSRIIAFQGLQTHGQVDGGYLNFKKILAGFSGSEIELNNYLDEQARHLIGNKSGIDAFTQDN